MELKFRARNGNGHIYEWDEIHSLHHSGIVVLKNGGWLIPPNVTLEICTGTVDGIEAYEEIVIPCKKAKSTRTR